jgi:hypothetical protein
VPAKRSCDEEEDLGKLSLRRETVRELVIDELGGVVGGVTGNMSICVCYSKPTNCTAALACQSVASCLSDACP